MRGINTTPNRWFNNESLGGGPNGSASELVSWGYDSVRIFIDMTPAAYSTHVANALLLIDELEAVSLKAIICLTYKPDDGSNGNSDFAAIEYEWVNTIIPQFDAKPALIGYEIFNEPHDVVTDDGSYHAYLPGCITRIRAETDKTLYVAGGHGSWSTGFPTLTPISDDNIVYTTHSYWPHDFTTVDTPVVVYPATTGTAFMQGSDIYGKDLHYAREFQVANTGTRIAVTEFGCMAARDVYSKTKWFLQTIGIFEQYGWDHFIFVYPNAGEFEIPTFIVTYVNGAKKTQSNYSPSNNLLL